MPYDFGDIVLVPFPFTSQAASKKRPAVVVSSPAYNGSKPDIVVMAVTSRLRASALFGEVWLQDWQAAACSNRPQSSLYWRLSSRSW